MRRLALFLAANALFTLAIGCFAFLYGWSRFARSLPDLHGWHTDAPASEFEAADAGSGYTLDDYLAQEGRVFDELGTLVEKRWSPRVTGAYSRFRIGSPSNPDTVLERNWNRSRVVEAPSPVGGALLVHGLSDSPYSLRRFGERLQGEGWTVVWLRVPGHGTCPGALARVSWRDWSAAVRVAVAGLRSRLPEGAPVTLVGFSNGGALCVDYAAAAAEDPSLPGVDSLILFSPMIGINPLSRIAALYPVIGRVWGMEKAGWSRVDAEIDPFKYASWPMNASVQAWRMTRHVEARLAALDKAGAMDRFPPVLTYQSGVDATVNVPAMITRLFDRLERPGSELVLFDVNRLGAIRDLVNDGHRHEVQRLLEGNDRPFTLTVLTNAAPDSAGIVMRRREAGGVTTTTLDAAWPPEVFSLSHGALPIPPDDPVLGTREATEATGLPLGSLDLRGETGVLTISESLMLRLRHNPFYGFVEEHALAWLKKTAVGASAGPRG